MDEKTRLGSARSPSAQTAERERDRERLALLLGRILAQAWLRAQAARFEVDQSDSGPPRLPRPNGM